MEKLFDSFERLISYFLTIIAVMILTYGSLELLFLVGEVLIESVRTGQFAERHEDLPIPVLFFEVLLWIEILQSVRLFTHDHKIKLKVILIIAMIAVVRHVFLLEMSHVDYMEEFTLAALIVAIAVSYFLVAKAEQKGGETKDEDRGH